MVTKIPNGSTPQEAISLQLMLTAILPIFSSAPVTGSVEITH